MKMRCLISLGCWLVAAASLPASVTPHVGFVYPAGGRAGETVTVTIGGQYLKDFSGLYLSNDPLKTKLTDYLRIYDRQEVSRIRRMKETLEAKMTNETDRLVHEQIQLQIDRVEQEMAMVDEVRRADRKSPGEAAKKQFNPQISERITLQLTLPASLKPGQYELRVMTTNGLSNPLVFEVGTLPEVSEKEPNNQISSADSLPALPVLVNGQILPGDVDCFRFRAAKGQTLVFRAQARALVPYLADAVPGWFQAVLTLYDAKGNEIAYDDDYRFDPDPVLIYTIPAGGEYTFSIRDSIFRGREDFVYRISVGETPFIDRISPLGAERGTTADVQLFGVNLPTNRVELSTGFRGDRRAIRVEKDGVLSNTRAFDVSPLPGAAEAEPDDSFAAAQPVKDDVAVDGTVSHPGDQDWFRFDGRKGDKKTVEVLARRLGSPLDSNLVLYNARQEVLASNDDFEDKSCGLLTHYADSRIDITLPERGTFYVRLTDIQNKGGEAYAYRLMIFDEEPDFQLRLVPSELCVPRNGTAIATVHAIRTGGFTGEIKLSAPDAPTGITVEPSVIPEGADAAPVFISARRTADERLVTLELEGRAGTVDHSAVPAEDMMQAFIYRHWVPSQQFLIRISDPEPVTVRLTVPRDGVLRANPGGEITIPASVRWNERPFRPVKLALADPPEWLTLKTAALGGNGGTVVLAVSPNAEPGDTATVLLSGTVRIPKSETDPDYNPVMKFMNAKTVEFTIDALSIQITN
jgi:hypothetical protein